jgi:HTH-like domain
MIDRTHSLPVVWQCQLLGVTRSTAYYQPMPVSDPVLALMRRIDELHLQYPFAGARMLRDLLRQEGHAIGWRRVATRMRRMGITAMYRTPQPRLGGGYHLHSHASRLRVSLRRPGLGESPSVGVATLQYADHGLLPRCGAGGDHAVWLPGDLQHGSRLPVHQSGVHRLAKRPGHPDQYGWPGLLAG